MEEVHRLLVVRLDLAAHLRRHHGRRGQAQRRRPGRI